MAVAWVSFPKNRNFILVARSARRQLGDLTTTVLCHIAPLMSAGALSSLGGIANGTANNNIVDQQLVEAPTSQWDFGGCQRGTVTVVRNVDVDGYVCESYLVLFKPLANCNVTVRNDGPNALLFIETMRSPTPKSSRCRFSPHLSMDPHMIFVAQTWSSW